MKVFLLGKVGSLTHWLEDIAASLRASGHQIRIGATRNPSIPAGVEAWFASPDLGAPAARWMAGRIAAFAPDLILAIDPYYCARVILERVSELPGRAPLAGWVGHLFDEGVRDLAEMLDVVGYIDSGLVELHHRLGFAARALYLPHAIDQRFVSIEAVEGPRDPHMIFVGNPTPLRRSILQAVEAPLALFGPGWERDWTSGHRISPRPVTPSRVRTLYARHLASLNIRNEHHLVRGLNQRSFQPYLFGAPVVSDDQADLERCFDSGSEVFVYRDTQDLNAIYDRIRREPRIARDAARLGQRRVLAEHTFGHRLQALMDSL